MTDPRPLFSIRLKQFGSNYTYAQKKKLNLDRLLIILIVVLYHVFQRAKIFKSAIRLGEFSPWMAF